MGRCKNSEADGKESGLNVLWKMYRHDEANSTQSSPLDYKESLLLMYYFHFDITLDEAATYGPVFFKPTPTQKEFFPWLFLLSVNIKYN